MRCTGANDPSAQLVPVDAALPDSMRRWTAPPVDLAALYPNYQHGPAAPQGLLQNGGGGCGSAPQVAHGSAPAAGAGQNGIPEPDTPPAAPPAALAPA